MADRGTWPDTWPDAVFFGIGAVLGVGLALFGCLIIPVKLALAVPIACASGIIFGLLGVAFREEVFFFLPPWQ